MSVQELDVPWSGAAPGRCYHKVKAGQNYRTIAALYKTSEDTLRRLNGFAPIEIGKVSALQYFAHGARHASQAEAYFLVCSLHSSVFTKSTLSALRYCLQTIQVPCKGNLPK